MRVMYDYTIGFDDRYDHSYEIYMIACWSTIPLDLIPITVVLLFHRYNLRQNDSSQSQQPQSVQEDVSEIRATVTTNMTHENSNNSSNLAAES